MALTYLRHSTVSAMDDAVAFAPCPKEPSRKFRKSKFSLLLSSNVIIWAIFAVSVMDVKVFSMDQIPVSFPQKLGVSGIVYNEKTPSAIISKQVYGIGDVVDGYTITRITRTDVEFEKNGKKLIRQTR